MKASLLILGALHRGDFHPYEIKRRLENAMVQCYTDVDVGTLYYAIQQLAKEGLITPAKRERVARGGMRTIYAITPKGRSAFKEMLHAQFAEEGPVASTLYGALLFLHLCDPEIVKELLERKIARTGELIAELRDVRKKLAPVLSTGSDHLMRHLDQQRRLDRSWLKSLLADVEAGLVRDVPDPKKLAPD